MILLVEDDPNDADLVRLVLESAQKNERVEVMPTGEQAMAYLSGEEPYRDRRAFPLPRLLLLDLRLPGISGLKVLAWLRARPELACMPVVVLTGSLSKNDIEQAYRLGANSVVVKRPDSFLNDVRSISGYWLGVSELV